MNYSFHPAAEEEFLEGINYYEDRQQNLGFDFAVEVYTAIGRAAALPDAWPILEGEVRRCQTRRFPYGILYSCEPDGIFVLAVMHLRRDPRLLEAPRQVAKRPRPAGCLSPITCHVSPIPLDRSARACYDFADRYARYQMVRICEIDVPSRAPAAETVAQVSGEDRRLLDPRTFGRTKTGGHPIDVEVYRSCCTAVSPAAAFCTDCIFNIGRIRNVEDSPCNNSCRCVADIDRVRRS